METKRNGTKKSTSSRLVPKTPPASTPLLTLKPKDFRKRTLALFKDLAADERLKVRFIKSPYQVIADRVAPELGIGRQQISESNRLLFALLANDGFRRWAVDYQRELRSKMEREGQKSVDRRQIKTDFAAAIAEHCDANIAMAILGSATDFGQGPGSAGFFIIKTESYFWSDVWFIYKVSGLTLEELPGCEPGVLRTVVDGMVARAKILSREGVLASPDAKVV